jgi:pyruvate/2-oxoglutarate/acetoin dehydrogenase E1 component
MTRTISYRQAINEAIDGEMARDETVLVIGEDVAGGTGGMGEMDAWGGPLGVTKGLWGKYGDRVMDTPISESAFIGAAIGAASCGMRPVVELMYMDFWGVCSDQIANQAAKFRYMFGGKSRTPVVIRTMIGAGQRGAAQHSGSYYSIYTHIPGLKVVVPSTPYDAKGLLITAIRDDDPVIFCEHKVMYDDAGEVPEEPYAIPFGQAKVVRQGSDLTIVALSMMVSFAAKAAEALAGEGISAEVIDPRTLSPLDEATILASVGKTGRLVVVDEANPRCGAAADISALVAQKGFASLRAPIELVTAPHTPVPFSPVLEDLYMPSPDRIAEAGRRTVGWSR